MDVIGEGKSRADGSKKVTGAAMYAGDVILPRMLHAVLVQSEIARGHVQNIDDAAVRRMPGVVDVLTFENAQRLHALENNQDNRPAQTYLVLQDNRVRYYRQHMAVVIAETLEQAQEAAQQLRIEYVREASNTNLDAEVGELFKPERITTIDAPPVDSERGTPVDDAPVRLSLRYTTPFENQNAMEPHATTAVWSDGCLELVDSTQWVGGVRNMVAKHLGIEPEKVRVRSPFVGGGFGSKGNPWPHPTLAAMAAQRTQRPVRLVFGRPQMFSQVGHRAATRQRFEIAAAEDGRLRSLQQDVVASTSQFDAFVEAAATTVRMAYSCPNVKTSHRLRRLDTNSPSPMRAPGEAPGTFALEVAMDELAYAAQVDPLALRLRNYAERDEDQDRPFSSKSLRDCYRIGAERFGWAHREFAPRSMRKGDVLVGWGMASVIFMVKLSPASAEVEFRRDGSAVVRTASHDIGTGTYTTLAQVAAGELGIAADRVRVELADTELPIAPAAAGSQTSGSVGSAVLLAARSAACKRKQSPEADSVVATETWKPTPMAERNWSGWSFGAHFCEVEVLPDIGRVHVARWVSAFGAGRVLNEKTAKSQLAGGIVWGLSQALLERTVHDDSSGMIVNANLAEYLIPVNADVPDIDVTLVPEEDKLVNAIGAKGMGELGICGAAAAVANAVYHATGTRVRDLPITSDKLLV